MIGKGNQKKANLFVVGAMKAGTTSFSSMLANHPDIYFSPVKEPNYFIRNLPKKIYTPSKFFNIEDYLKEKYPAPLHIARIIKKDHYDSLFRLSHSGQKYLAEGSTAYLHAPETPALIHAYNPEAKIIILIKDGLTRAFSHYKMDLGLGRTLETFQKSMEDNLRDLKQGCLDNWSYLGMSLYSENIERYNRIFGRNVLVIHSEDLFKNTEVVLQKLFDFLEIENTMMGIQHDNKSSNIRFVKVLYFLKQSGLKDLISSLLPEKIRHAAFSLLKKKKPLKMNLTPKLAGELNAIFNEDKLKICSSNA